MNIVLWVTEKCNMNCDYCYVKKRPKSMSMETAEGVFDYFRKMLSQRELQNGEIHIGFHGGEPLLNFPVIKYLVERFKAEYGKKIKYFSLTTNGTISDEKTLEYLMENIELSISIDGKRYTNDLKRHYGDGRSSFDDTIHTLKFIKKNNTVCRIRMTVDPGTINRFAENYIFLDKMDTGIVTYAINLENDWSDDDMEAYYDQLVRIMEYFVQNKPNEGKYFLYNLKNSTFRCRSYCDGGITNFHISPDGQLYPCILAMGHEEFVLGDISTGIIEKELNSLQKINNGKVAGCEGCDFIGHCDSQVCKIINKVTTGNYYTPEAASCSERKVIERLCKKYMKLLEGFGEY